jgi:ribosomal protein S18 acetylase RimI-like enzyme
MKSGCCLLVLKGRELLGSTLAEQILELDLRNMQHVLAEAGIDFPFEKRRKGLESDATFILAFDGEMLAGYLDYLRSWTNPDHIYIGSVQIEKRYRGSRLLLRLLDQFSTLVAAEDFAGFETNVQKVNVAAANLYRKIGFTLEPNPRNDASWTARAGKSLLTDSPLATLLNRLNARRTSGG